MYGAIVSFRSKHSIGVDLPIVILTDANVSLKRDWSIDDNTDTSIKHFVTGSLALEGNHDEKHKHLFVNFCHCLGLRALNTWDWQSASITNNNQHGTNTYFSRSSIGSNSQIDFVLTTSHFLGQARTLVPAPTRKAIWEQSDHHPVLGNAVLLLKEGAAAIDARNTPSVDWRSLKGWEPVDESRLQAFRTSADETVRSNFDLCCMDDELTSLAYATCHTTTSIRKRINLEGIVESEYRLAKEAGKWSYDGPISNAARRNDLCKKARRRARQRTET